MDEEREVDGRGGERWATLVWEAHRGKCSNCGSDDRVRAELIIPEAAGGRKLVSNGTLLCRTCSMARVIVDRHPHPVSGDRTRPINFFVSRPLYDKLRNGLLQSSGCRSVSSLLRDLMTCFMVNPDRYDDLELYQDPGSDVKVNVWVDRDLYDRFREIVDRRGMTVTDTLKGMIKLYEVQAEGAMRRSES